MSPSNEGLDTVGRQERNRWIVFRNLGGQVFPVWDQICREELGNLCVFGRSSPKELGA